MAQRKLGLRRLTGCVSRFRSSQTAVCIRTCCGTPLSFARPGWACLVGSRPSWRIVSPPFRTYSLVLAMSESWNAAAAQTFGCQKCMEQLGKLYRLHGLLEEQTTGQVPEHPIIDQHVPRDDPRTLQHARHRHYEQRRCVRTRRRPTVAFRYGAKFGKW